jgi:hypothetical protein
VQGQEMETLMDLRAMEAVERIASRFPTITTTILTIAMASVTQVGIFSLPKSHFELQKSCKTAPFLFFLFFFSWQYWSLNSGPYTC